MASRIRFSYQWRLFIPIVVSLWAMIICVACLMYYNERQYRIQSINEQLSLINARIVTSYSTDSDPLPFMDFVWRYYRESPLFDRVRISVYLDGEIIRCYGLPISLTETERLNASGLTENPFANGQTPSGHSDKSYFYYSVGQSADGRMTVYTVLPFDNDINAATLPSSKIFLVLLVIAIVMTVFAYFSTRHYGYNIKILRSIAQRAATDPNFMPAMDYPHDELGDISRQIVHIYNERSKAVLKLKKEHAIVLQAIEEKARAKRQLTNNINHELRTPIGVIKGYLDTILDNPDMDEASKTHFLSKARDHVNRLVNLIADVSAITRLEEGGDRINTEEINFHDIVYTIAADVENSGSIGNMSFEYDIPLDCLIHGNYNLLTGMLINLVKNAVAYSKGKVCEVIVENEDDDFYHFVFRDDGVGVGEEHLPHLFERFYRIDTGRARKSGGTGLGLPIVQNTIIAHGGTIYATNRVGGGLEFHFTLRKYHDKQNGTRNPNS